MEAARHGEDQCHGDIGRVIRQDARRIGDGDTALNSALDVDIVDAGAELGDQAQLVSGPRQDAAVNPVCYGRDEDIGRLDGSDEFFMGKGVIVLIEAGIKQFLHAQLDSGWQLPGHDDLQFLSRHVAPLHVLHRA